MNVLDLFSGVGGFSLGLERAGMRTVAFCESDPYCRAVLAKHWPQVPCYDDVRTLTGDQLRADGISVDLVSGGFPCQDLSVAGRGAGLDGKRSGLWSEFARIIGELRPSYAIVENVAVLTSRGLDRILGDLAEIGYDAEWSVISAADVGAPHLRERIWIVAYPGGDALDLTDGCGETGWRDWPVADAERTGFASWGTGSKSASGCQADGGRAATDFAPGDQAPRVLADAEIGVGRPGLCASVAAEQRWRQSGDRSGAGDMGLAGQPRLALGPGTLGQWAHAATTGTGWWAAEPDVGRVAHGVPARVDRLRALGNALVPAVPEIIGRAIMAIEQ